MVTTASLSGLAAIVDTANDQSLPAGVVFNPTTRPRSDVVSAQVPVTENGSHFVLVSDKGEIVQPQISERSRDVMWEMVMPADQFAPRMNQVPYEIDSAGIQGLSSEPDGPGLNLDILLARGQPPNVGNVRRGQADVASALGDGEIKQVRLLVHYGDYAHCTFVAPDVPGLGYRAFRVQHVDEPPDQTEATQPTTIANGFFHIRADEDGTFTLTDKRTGTLYPGLNHFVDVGDRGDEYNSAPWTILTGSSYIHLYIRRFDTSQ